MVVAAGRVVVADGRVVVAVLVVVCVLRTVVALLSREVLSDVVRVVRLSDFSFAAVPVLADLLEV